MKVLLVPDEGLCPYWDWLEEPYNTQFIEGGYTHVGDPDNPEDICEAHVTAFSNGTSGVCLGESIQ